MVAARRRPLRGSRAPKEDGVGRGQNPNTLRSAAEASAGQSEQIANLVDEDKARRGRGKHWRRPRARRQEETGKFPLKMCLGSGEKPTAKEREELQTPEKPRGPDIFMAQGWVIKAAPSTIT